MSRNWGEHVGLFFVILFLIGFALQFSAIPQEARVYPFMLLVLCGGLVLFLLFRSIQASSSLTSNQTKGNAFYHFYTILRTFPRYRENDATIKQSFRIFIFCLLVLLYIFLIIKISYVLATVLYMFFALFIQGIRNKPLLLLLPVLVTSIVYVFFSKILHIILPTGEWIYMYF